MMDIRRTIELVAITKSFGSVQALKDITVTIERGTVHALVGENGAGKSTLGKVISGAIAPDEGILRIDGEAVHLRSPRDALTYGMTGIAQELALLPARTVMDNVFLGVESKRWGVVATRALRARYDELRHHVGLDVDPKLKVRDLRIADQQKVEILRAMARSADLIVLDEPTSALPLDDARNLLLLVRRLAESGSTVVLVSHNLKDVLAVSDAVTVLKDGRHVHTSPAAGQSEESLIEAILGRSLDAAFPAKEILPGQGIDVPALRVRELSGSSGLTSASFQVAPGEIVGVAGLVGSGRTEMLRTIFGADRRLRGSVAVAGVECTGGPHASLAHGLVMLPENRRDEGLLLRRAVDDNVVLSRLSDFTRTGVVRRRAVRAAAAATVSRLRIKAPALGTPVADLSGGNQQKVLFGRCLLKTPKVLLADEPTRGVDIGAKLAIYELIVDTAASGVGVLFASSDMDEILGLSHRVLVMRNGRVVDELVGGAITESNVMRAAFGAGNSACNDLGEVAS
jgi:rhamnose transport system ATP-binding protein